ncbi:conserved Plasmodium protein, unknown function [Plasmodium vinckei brucechwatti]|uniref:Uncharacterized protein n=1 Tax=Plasmodium vinckei brucechwatti TaxID=119398 RepID=A0A6V7T0Z5_PLAVN|nr:conserved Plasmodium protein, unknown function [Plasmodium vinckei brucechwatti]
MIKRVIKLNLVKYIYPKRRLQTFINKDEKYSVDKNDELSFLSNEIKHNLHKLKCIEQKKVKSDRIIYKKILKDLLKEKENFVADEVVSFLYILTYNDLYYLDISSNFFSYFYKNYIFSKNYFININVNSIIHVIYSYYLFENYNFLVIKNNPFFDIKGHSNNGDKKTTHLAKENVEFSHLSAYNTLNQKDNTSKVNENYTHDGKNTLFKQEDIYINGVHKNEEKKGIKRINSYNEYYNNQFYGIFHIYNYFSKFISSNIDYINKNHIIKILLVLSQFIHNFTVNEITHSYYKNESGKLEHNKQQLLNIGENLFALIEAFIEKIDIKKNIKKSHAPETINEKEVKKKEERYVNLIDNSFKNFIYIDNDLNDHKLMCLFLYILSNIFHPISPHFFISTNGDIPTEKLNVDDIVSNYKNEIKSYDENTPEKNKSPSLSHGDEIINEDIQVYNNIKFSVIDMFKRHYNKIEIHNIFYKNIDNEKSDIHNFTVYRNNLLKSVKRYIFIDTIYKLDVHYKLIFFKAIYSLNFFNFPYLKYIYFLHLYYKSNNTDNFDYYDHLYFQDSQNLKIEFGLEGNQTDVSKIDQMKQPIEQQEKEQTKHIVSEQNNESKIIHINWIKNKILELSKRGDIFNNVYINLLNDIENSIQNNSAEQNINNLLQMHLLRYVDNHFTIMLLSKLCNSVDKLANDHKKKVNVVINSMLMFFPPHIQYCNLPLLKNKSPYAINIYNHIYYNNNAYIKHLNKLYDFLILLYNKQIFKKKRKELLSWANYKYL